MAPSQKAGSLPEDMKKQCVELFWSNVNTHSGMVNSDSGKTGKSVHVQPDWVFTFNQNRCSRSTGMGVHFAPEYAEK
jgi:hypothetical protein